MMDHNKIKALIFDLDDTLANTWDTLTPIVLKNIANDLSSLGHTCTDEQIELARANYLNRNLRKDLVSFLFDTINLPTEDENLASKLNQIKIQNQDIKDISSLKLHNQVKPILGELKSKYLMYLVSEGNPIMQKNKVKHLGIGSFFSSVYYIDKSKKQTKVRAFSQILISLNLVPSQILCIGNRVDREIAEAKKIGIKTCWVKQGPYKNWLPLVDNEVPDFIINDLRELIDVCKL